MSWSLNASAETSAGPVAWGAEDPWMPITRGARLAGVKGCCLKALPGLDHRAQLGAPRAFLTAEG
ncbi:MAG: hypothetical protein AAGI70_08605 [Pseudomonadota bacterium]